MAISKTERSTLKSETINDQIENHSHDLLSNGKYAELLKMKSVCEKMHYPDTTNALLLKYLFIAMKKLGDVDMKFLHRNLIMNNERNNFESVTVLLNAILKVMIANRLFKEARVYANYLDDEDENVHAFDSSGIENYVLENEFLKNDYLYFYQSGVVLMFNGEYAKALEKFRRSLILRPTLRTIKYERLCLMLNNEFEMVDGFENFFERYAFRDIKTISAPECSILSGFEEKIASFLRLNENEKLQCRYIIKRLYINLQFVVTKKITTVYSAVPIHEVCHLIGLSEKEAINLFEVMINNKEIYGTVIDGVYRNGHICDSKMVASSVEANKLISKILDKNYDKSEDKPFCVENYLDENGSVRV